jgi:hypothetical protein
LHHEWENSLPQVVAILKRIIPGMTFRRAVRIMREALTSARAVVKRCHKELLQKEALL